MEKISILMAIYNPNIPFLIEQLKSLNNQDYENLGLYVIDDCSTRITPDEIKIILSEYLKDIPYTFHVNTNNMGSNRTFEELTKIANGDYFAYCDQDDIWESNKLSTLLAKMKEEQAVIAYSDLAIIDEAGNFVTDSLKNITKRLKHEYGEGLFRFFLRSNSITGCTMLMKANVAKEAITFPSSEIYVHDHWLALYGSHKGSIAYVDQPLIRYRIHSNNQIGANVLVGINDKRDYLEKRVLMEELKVKFVKSRQFPPSNNKDINDYQAFLSARKNYLEKTNLSNLLSMLNQIKKDPVLIIFEILLGISGSIFSKYLLKFAKK